jgi:hypothetical protein
MLNPVHACPWLWLSNDLLQHICEAYVPTFPYRMLLRETCRELSQRLPQQKGSACSKVARDSIEETLAFSPTDVGWVSPSVIRWCWERKYTLPESVLLESARMGNLSLVKWSRETLKAPSIDSLIEIVAGGGRAKALLVWLFGKGCPRLYRRQRHDMIRGVSYRAATDGALDVLEWMYRHKSVGSNVDWGRVLALASDYKHTPVVEWIATHNVLYES